MITLSFKGYHHGKTQILGVDIQSQPTNGRCLICHDDGINVQVSTQYKELATIEEVRFLGHRSHRLQWPIVITRCPASVRPSSVKLFTFSTSSPEPLDGFWWNLVWMKYSRSLTSVVVFRPDPSRGGSRAGQKKVRGGPLLQETSSSDRKATATNQMHSSDLETCGKKCCYFWFHSEVKFLTRFWRLFGLNQISLI